MLRLQRKVNRRTLGTSRELLFQRLIEVLELSSRLLDGRDGDVDSLRKLIPLEGLSRENRNGGQIKTDGEKADTTEPLAPLSYAAPTSITMIAF